MAKGDLKVQGNAMVLKAAEQNLKASKHFVLWFVVRLPQ
jgi:hypothetical protein